MNHLNTMQNPNGMGSSNNMMDSLKSNMMTMLMINNMNGGNRTNSSGGNDMFSMIYVFVATSVVDFVFKNAPVVMNFFMKKYSDKLETIKKDLSNVTKDITDNKVKTKTASITVTINVNNTENILGQALLDFITNNKNTTHVSYIRESFILNQKDVINIDDEIFAKMTQSSSSDEMGNQGSISTNMNSGAGDGVNGNNSAIVQIVEIYSFTKTTDELRNFLDNIKQKYSINVKNKLGNKRYYFNMHPLVVPMDIEKRKDLSRLPPHFVFVMKHFQTNRKFSNLFGEDIEIIRNRVNFFCKNKKWYDEKGIPYTLGLLLSGAPGTGKTSTIKCLANETNRHICNVNLNNDMSKTQLENLFYNENINIMNPMTGQNETYCIPLDQRIYVLEDVDCQSDIVMERALKNDKKNTDTNKDRNDDKAVLEHYEDKHKVDLSFLLNLLDGVLENPGRIVIMTSNFPDTLDSALIRPGRIDVIAKFKNCSNKTIIDMLEFFYDTKLSDNDMLRINLFKEEIITPAELSKVMFENFSDVQATISHVENLSEKKVNEDNKPIIDLELLTNEEPVNEKPILPNSSCTSIEELEEFLSKNPMPTYKPLSFNPLTNTIEEELIVVEPPKDYSSIVDNYDNERLAQQKAKIDFRYAFMHSVLPQYASKENISKKTNGYYYNLLDKYLFSLKKSMCNNNNMVMCNYYNMVQELKKRFNKIMTGAVYLEEIMSGVDGLLSYDDKLLKATAYEYRLQISRYFTIEFMVNSGIWNALKTDHIIDAGFEPVSLENTKTASSKVVHQSNETSYLTANVALNTSTYSAF